MPKVSKVPKVNYNALKYLLSEICNLKFLTPQSFHSCIPKNAYALVCQHVI